MVKKLLLLLLFGCFFFCLPSKVAAKDYSFSKVDFVVQLNRDGSALVEEKRTFDFDGCFTWAEEWIPKGAGNYKDRNYQLTDFKVCDEAGCFFRNSSGKSGTFLLNEQVDRYYLKWFYSACNKSKVFTISYRIEKAVLVHTDIAEFYWQLVGDKWGKSVSRVAASVFLPSPGVTNPENIYGFGHGPLNGKISIPSPSAVVFTADRLSANKFFEIRVLFEKEIIDEAYLQANQDKLTLAQVIDEESTFAQKNKQQGRLLMIVGATCLVAVLLLFVLFVIAFVKYLLVWWRMGKDEKLPEINLSGSLHEPPSGLDPFALETLLAGKKQATSKAVVATILELVNKKVLALQSVKKTNLSFFGMPLGYQYSLEIREDTNQSKTILSQTEQKIIDFIFDKISKDGKKVTFKEISRYLRAHSASFYKLFKQFKTSGFKTCLKKGLFEKESFTFSKKNGYPFGWLGLTVLSFVLSSIAFIAIVAGSVDSGTLVVLNLLPLVLLPLNALFFLQSFILLPVWFILVSFAQKRSKKGMKEAASWLAFKKYLQDYRVTKKSSIDSVVLWGKYLVYGTALGVSTKALSQLPIKFSASDAQTAGWGFASQGSFNSTAGLSHSLSGLSSSLSSLSSSFASSGATGASGSGSSGGFSGGGGGGGGGGAG